MAADDLPSRQWVFEQLVRTEQHWTSQRQNQQARVATTLTVTGVMLTLLAPLGLGRDKTTLTSWAHEVLVFSLIALGLALLAGVAALWPVTPPTVEQFNCSECFKTIHTNGQKANDESQFEPVVDWPGLIGSFPDSSDTRDVIQRRRWLIWCQLTLLAAAGLLLLVAFGSAA